MAPRRFDALLCLDPRRAFGDLGSAAARAGDWLRPGGQLVIGAHFQRRGGALIVESPLQSHGGVVEPYGESVRAFVGAGFELSATQVLGEAEWDDYVGAQRRALLAHAAEHLDDIEAAALRERAEAAYQSYWRHGRDHIGYALHLLRKPRPGSRLQVVRT